MHVSSLLTLFHSTSLFSTTLTVARETAKRAPRTSDHLASLRRGASLRLSMEGT